jgi:hypothetical protein
MIIRLFFPTAGKYNVKTKVFVQHVTAVIGLNFKS